MSTITPIADLSTEAEYCREPETIARACCGTRWPGVLAWVTHVDHPIEHSTAKTLFLSWQVAATLLVTILCIVQWCAPAGTIHRGVLIVFAIVSLATTSALWLHLNIPLLMRVLFEPTAFYLAANGTLFLVFRWLCVVEWVDDIIISVPTLFVGMWFLFGDAITSTYVRVRIGQSFRVFAMALMIAGMYSLTNNPERFKPTPDVTISFRQYTVSYLSVSFNCAVVTLTFFTKQFFSVWRHPRRFIFLNVPLVFHDPRYPRRHAVTFAQPPTAMQLINHTIADHRAGTAYAAPTIAVAAAATSPPQTELTITASTNPT